MENNYPFNDDDLRYDYEEHMYVLTESYVLRKLNINMAVELNTAAGANSALAVENELRHISSIVYGYLYTFNNAATIEFIIAKSPSAREIIKKALRAQLAYMKQVGDLSYTTDRTKREFRIDEVCKQVLSHVVWETGKPLTYIGQYNFFPPYYTHGGY